MTMALSGFPGTHYYTRGFVAHQNVSLRKTLVTFSVQFFHCDDFENTHTENVEKDNLGSI